MDEKTFKERASRIEEIGKVIDRIPSEIRALAFPLLTDYVLRASPHSQPQERKTSSYKSDQAAPSDREELFKAFPDGKPSENAKLIAASFYREFGIEPFSLEEVKTTAKDTGIVIPERVDMTFAQAKEDGKNLFTSAGKGRFRPTVHGEVYLKATYKVIKGTNRRPAPAE